MIERCIRWSLQNRALVLLLTLALTSAGIWAVKNTAVDAIPDLSDVQVIIRTSLPGQSPQVVEDQVTYPLSTAMLAVPGAKTVRGFSFFADSFVYVVFEDGTDLYWARARVLEYLNQVTDKLPAGARPALGPDATGVGWVYEYALVDRSGQHDLSQLRSIQDWFLKYELQTVPGVAEVATIGGMVRQYQVVLRPEAVTGHRLSLREITAAIKASNQEVGGSVVEMGEAEYMVRATGYLTSLQDIESIPIRINNNGVPLYLRDIATVQIGPQMRRGIAELDGEGEVVGGVVVMRSGENARHTIAAVKRKLDALKAGLPAGVEVVETYDRSALIDRSVDTLMSKLAQEFIVVAIVCAVFLFHIRSSLVIIVSLPVGILTAFLIMQAQGLNANIMSLGGIAIAIGAMVDAAIVMVESVHKKMEGKRVSTQQRWQLVEQAAIEVGPPLFFSLLIITFSFLPVFALQAQEGRLFAPLAFTKTYAMAAAAGLSVTLVPVLMGYLVRGRITEERKNPINRGLTWLYKPLIGFVTSHPRWVIALAVVVMIAGALPASRLGSEFMPDLDEGDLMYMPTTFPGLSIGEAQQLLQTTDKLIKSVPEVKTVFGKIGRAETATDPAPLTMIETVIQLHPPSQWREGMDMDAIRSELNQRVQIPGLTNAWVWPIKTRIDMLATGIKTPVGVKIAGPDLDQIQRIGQQLEQLLNTVSGTASVFSERVAGGRYITVDIDRAKAAQYGLNIDAVQSVVRTAIGGMNVTETVEGRERYPINVRYPQAERDSVQAIADLQFVSPTGQLLDLSMVAEIRVEAGAPMIKSENAKLNGWVYVDIEGRDLGGYVQEARQIVMDQLDLPAGYSIDWSGQYEYMQRATERLRLVVPIALLTIVFLLYLNFKNLVEVAIILGTLPMALAGGFGLLYLLDYNLSVAVGVGFIALAGVAIETGVVMLVFLNQALAEQRNKAKQLSRDLSNDDLEQAVVAGALLRIRPIMMTVATVIAGLLPIMLGGGTGSEVMRRVAAPMVGGMFSATLLTLAVIPAVFLVWQRHRLKQQ
ncbi:MAG: cation transporter [Lysobacteraceae bacterium]|nr:MAG: cation transporter [Xanthomonadaceae bacterium]